MRRLFQHITTHDFAVLLLDKSYVSFLLSVVFSQVAFNMMNVVLIFLVFNLTSSNFLVSMILLISLLPQVFLSFVGGVIADSNNKKSILILGNIGRASVVFLLIFFNSTVALVYLFAFLVSVVTQFYIPAETPIIPKLVPEKLLIAANSLFGLALFGSILIGYVIAGPIYAALGNSYVFIVVALLFALAGFFAHLIPDFALKITPLTVKKRVKAQVQESLQSYFIGTYKLLLETKGVASSFILLIVSQVVIMVLAIIVPGYANDILKINVENVSLLLFAPAALGMITAALCIGSLFKTANRDRLMDIGLMLSGIVLLSLPFISSSPVVLSINSYNSLVPNFLHTNTLVIVSFLSFFAGIGNALIFIPAQTTIQERIPENFRSKMYGLLFAMIGLFSLLPIALVGGLADNIGVNTVLVIIGCLIFFGGAIYIALSNVAKIFVKAS
ncbi:MAG: MFS transporter [Candidatus Levybacteria bacterium]|nr:MFS transporter [Candidatus Levybacteria bacterium]